MSTKGEVSKHLKEKPLRKYKKALPVNLTADEKVANSTAAGKLTAKIERMKEKLKKRMAGAKTKIAEAETRLREMMRVCATGQQVRELDCVDIPVYAEDQVEIVRLDDSTVVETRPMTAGERQGTLTTGKGTKVTDIKDAKKSEVKDVPKNGEKDAKGEKK